MDISIVIPVFNEERNLPILHKQISSIFDSLNKDYEIIYIDDGSTDKSFEILKELELCTNKVRLISFDKNYGKTFAIDAGFRNAEGRYVLTIDSDLQYNPHDLIRVLNELKDNDIVICRRSNRRRIDGYIKYISSMIANGVRNKVLKESFKDAGCFLAGYKRECLDKLVLYDGFEVFIYSLLNIGGYKIKEIEIEAFPRRYGKSKYNIRNRLFKGLYCLFIVKWMQKKFPNYKIKYLS